MGPESFDPKTDFRYVIGEKPELVIIMLYGKIGTRELPALQELEAQVHEKTQKIVLINLHDVTTFHATAHCWFAQLQRKLRDREKAIGICGLRPEIKSSLLMAGIVRVPEIFDNVPAAWRELGGKKRSA